MGMARGEPGGDRGGADAAARGEPVAALATATSVAAAFADHAPALRAHLLRAARDAATADDLVQEAFVRLLTETAAGRPPLHVRAWLFRVASNLHASRARRDAVAARHVASLTGHGATRSPEELVIERESALSMDSSLAGLAPDVRTALVLAAHGFSGAEIARRIGRSELATRSLLCRQRRRLRSSIPPAA